MTNNPHQIRLQELAHKYLQGSLTEEEQREFDEWFNQTSDEPLENFGIQISDEEEHRNAILKLIRDELQIEQSPRVRSLWTRLSVAVSITLLLCTGVAIYTVQQTQKESLLVDVQPNDDIAPGKNTATLTLSDGSKIVLSKVGNGELARQAGVTVSKNETKLVYLPVSVPPGRQIKDNTLETARGEQYQVVLPDGTNVWLNAASSLTFPETFSSLPSRKVKLIGEAYFEVAKDKLHPFKVESSGQVVEVLGTHFNINSYQDESSVKTTVLEGSVQVNKSVVLKPDEQAILKGSKIRVIPVVANSIIDWKEGVFAFKNESLESVMRKIARWYDVQVIYQTDERDHQTYTGTISRSDNVSKVLGVLEETGGFDFRLQGKKIFVMKK